MSQFIGTSMPKGFAGELTRGYYDNTIEIKENDGSVTAFGVPVKLGDGKAAATSAAADVVYGFSVRTYGQANMDGKQAQPFVSVLRRGYIAVINTGGTPAAGAQAYLTAEGKITAEKSSNTAIPGCMFMGTADASGLAEIAFNI